MKTELTIVFLKTGILNKYISKIAAQNNEGLHQFLISDIYGYAICKASEYPFTLRELKVVLKQNKLSIMENGKDININIEEKQIK
jgi:hypothetical protein